MYTPPVFFFSLFHENKLHLSTEHDIVAFSKSTNYVKSRYTEQPLAYLFFSSKTSSLTMRAIRVPHGRTSLADKKTTQALETWAGLLLRLFLGLKNITTLKHGLSIVRTFNRVINHVPPLLPLGRPQLLIQCCSILSDAPFYIILLKNNGQKNQLLL